jgi:DNA-binding cell septation regulator SpoVG
MNPKITKIKLYPYIIDKGKYKIVAYADIEIANVFEIRGISLYMTEREGYFISLPTKKIRGDLFEIIKINKKDYERYMRRTILDEYKKEIGVSDGS